MTRKKQLLSKISEKVLSLVSNLYFFCNTFSPFIFGVFRDYDATISENFIAQFKTVNAQSIELMDDAIRVYMKICVIEIEKCLSEGLAIGVFEYNANALPNKNKKLHLSRYSMCFYCEFNPHKISLVSDPTNPFQTC